MSANVNKEQEDVVTSCDECGKTFRTWRGMLVHFRKNRDCESEYYRKEKEKREGILSGDHIINNSTVAPDVAIVHTAAPFQKEGPFYHLTMKHPSTWVDFRVCIIAVLNY